MNKKAVSNIDFADSEYQSFFMDEHRNVTVYLKSWDAKKIIITFYNTLQFLYKLESIGKQLYEVGEDTLFLKDALELEYGNRIPINHPFKLYELEDIDDVAFIKVVAESVTVGKDRSQTIE